MKIACVGDNCVDFYDATQEAYPGGNPVNVSVYVRRLGGESSYIGAVGSDANGKLMIDALAGKGVDVSHVQVLPGATALSHVARINGERVFGDYEEGVMADFKLTDGDLDFICQHDLAVTGLWGHAENDLAEIQHRGIPVAFDGAERPFDPAGLIALPHTDIAFFSDDESDEETLKETILKIAAMGPKIVVATRGGKGSLAYAEGKFYPHGIVKCNVVDTMGAGDSFITGFLMAWLEGKVLPTCMSAGAENAAVTLGYNGAW